MQGCVCRVFPSLEVHEQLLKTLVDRALTLPQQATPAAANGPQRQGQGQRNKGNAVAKTEAAAAASRQAASASEAAAEVLQAVAEQHSSCGAIAMKLVLEKARTPGKEV